MNRKSVQERARIIQLLVEGNSLRAASRITDSSLNTVTKLLVDVGAACFKYQSENLINLPCQRVQVDEIWSFVYAKRDHVRQDMPPYAGDVWTWTAVCADTKIVPAWRIGARDAATARDFMEDLAGRMANRIQLTTDGFAKYPEAVENAFGANVDYGMLVKIYDEEGRRRQKYLRSVRKKTIGRPDVDYITTAHVERQNLAMRMSMRRFTRKSNGFSKKLENHAHSVALHFMHYNFVRIHKTLRVTPAMAAGVTDRLWSFEDLAKMVD